MAERSGFTYAAENARPAIASARSADVWLQIVDAALAGVIFLVPLLMGGRHPLGQLTLVVLAATMSVAWAARMWRLGDARWRPTGAALLLAAGGALVLLQAAPLPPAALKWLAPQNAALLPLWNSADTAGLGQWQSISLTPAETLAGLTLFVAYSLVFLVVVQRVRAVDDVERLLRWCGLAAVGMAAFGLAQFLAGNGKFFWFYQHPYADTFETVKGSFSNRNHFAQFLAMGIGPLVWWLQDAARRSHTRPIRNRVFGGADIPVCQDRRVRPGRQECLPHPGEKNGLADLPPHLPALALGVVLFATMLSLSRGGIVAAALAAAIVTAVCYRASAIRGKVVGGLAIAGLLIAVSLAVFGYERVSNRLNSLSSGSLEKLDGGRGRRVIWATAMTAAADRPLLGAGVGSFGEVFPAYADVPLANCEPTHGENCYLQVALETGGVGLTLLLIGVGLCGWWCVRGCAGGAGTRLQVCAGAIAASLAASAMHAAVDFVWYVPACAALVAVLAACALRVRQLSNPRVAAVESAPLPRFAPALAVAVLLLVGGWMTATCFGPAMAAPDWDRYLIASNALDAETSVAEQELIDRLERVVFWQPRHARAQLALAEEHLRLFDKLQATAANPMSLPNVRDAVLQSQFPSRDAMLQWLSRAVGEHAGHLQKASWHARQALRQCPLQGRGYVYLAELCFLDGGLRPSAQACVDQALRVRPFDAAVLYAAANEAYLAGDPAKWLEYAKQAFCRGRIQQRQLTADLIAHAPAEGEGPMIDFLLREFQPDLEGVRFLYSVCAKACRPEQLTAVRRAWAEKAEDEARRATDTEATTLWVEAQHLRVQLNEGPRALQCCREALRTSPDNYDVHCQLAIRLMEQGQYAEAESQWRWCLQRTPDNLETQNKLKEALRGRLDAERRAAATKERLR